MIYEYGFNTVNAVYQFHTVFQTKNKAGGAERVSIGGSVGNNGDGSKSVICRIACFGIEYVMIYLAVLNEKALIVTGCHNGFVCDLNVTEAGSASSRGTRIFALAFSPLLCL